MELAVLGAEAAGAPAVEGDGVVEADEDDDAVELDEEAAGDDALGLGEGFDAGFLGDDGVETAFGTVEPAFCVVATPDDCLCCELDPDLEGCDLWVGRSPTLAEVKMKLPSTMMAAK